LCLKQSECSTTKTKRLSTSRQGRCAPRVCATVSECLGEQLCACSERTPVCTLGDHHIHTHTHTHTHTHINLHTRAHRHLRGRGCLPRVQQSAAAAPARRRQTYASAGLCAVRMGACEVTRGVSASGRTQPKNACFGRKRTAFSPTNAQKTRCGKTEEHSGALTKFVDLLGVLFVGPEACIARAVGGVARLLPLVHRRGRALVDLAWDQKALCDRQRKRIRKEVSV
jgi:hypothetical protein